MTTMEGADTLLRDHNVMPDWFMKAISDLTFFLFLLQGSLKCKKNKFQS